MKFKNILFFPFAGALFLAGCGTMKKVDLDPVQITANRADVTIYHGSYTKLTDIINTKLDISFNWDSAFVIGKASIEAKPYFYPSGQVVLSAKGFKINEVSLVKKDSKQADVQKKVPLKYSYNGKLIDIQLDKVYTRDERFTLFIDYVAMPGKLKVGADIGSDDDRGIYFINRDGKDKELPKQIWTQGESECNSNWFPTIDGPQEKMTQEISITAPNNMVTLSNGELDFSSNNGNGTHTDTWRQDKPHSTYLTMMAVGDFVITKDKWKGKEVSYYMEPKYAPFARLIFGKTPEMIDFFSKRTAIDFPWDKYSQIVVRNFVSGAMENTTATVFFDRMNMNEGEYQDENYEDIVSHELFHHWFGDLVTCESWANLPLNESFATYGEYLWNEYKYGRDYADYGGYKDLQKYLSVPKNKELNVIRYDYADREQMFDDVTYEKGGRILHMLRKTVGDEAFFKALNNYLTKNAYKTAEINDLRMAFEEVTGQDLNWFFNEWFLAAGNPKLDIQTHYDPNLKQASVTIRQLQDLDKMPLYRIPLSVDIYTANGTERKEIVLDKQDQTFAFSADTEPQLINVDAEKYILCEKTESKTIRESVFQYEHAPLFIDRLEAVSGLISFKKEKPARAELIKALKDKNWYIRKIAVDFVQQLDEEERNQVYQSIKQMAVSDERSYVRAAAITVLNQVYKNRNNDDVLQKAKTDIAPSVVKALSGL